MTLEPISIQEQQQLISEYQSVKACLGNATASLNAFMSSVQVLMADPNYIGRFNLDWTNYANTLVEQITIALKAAPTEPEVKW